LKLKNDIFVQVRGVARTSTIFIVSIERDALSEGQLPSLCDRRLDKTPTPAGPRTEPASSSPGRHRAPFFTRPGNGFLQAPQNSMSIFERKFAGADPLSLASKFPVAPQNRRHRGSRNTLFFQLAMPSDGNALSFYATA
jgi:hypothetical protein